MAPLPPAAVSTTLRDMTTDLAISAWLRRGESLGDRILKLDHAGENGAVHIYAGQIVVARWQAPELVADLADFQLHERRHRALFGAEIDSRAQKRCKSFRLCAVGGFALGLVSGLLGRSAIAATTVAVESVVLRHLRQQIAVLNTSDARAARVIADIVAEETAHHDRFEAMPGSGPVLAPIVTAVVSASTELVIWLGMRL